MNTKPILTYEEIIAIGHQTSSIEPGENGYILPVAFARAIEQAVLQSDEIQRLRGIEAQAERIVSRYGGDGDYLVLTVDLDRLRATMEKKND